MEVKSNTLQEMDLLEELILGPIESIRLWREQHLPSVRLSSERTVWEPEEEQALEIGGQCDC